MIGIDHDLDRHIQALGDAPEPPTMTCGLCKAEHNGFDDRPKANEVYNDWLAELSEDMTVEQQQPDQCIDCRPEDFYDDGSDNWRNE